jgi:uncharacterized membrane protein YfcA
VLEVFGLSLAAFGLLAAVVVIGALVQSVIGLGVSVVFAPVVGYVVPQALPAVPLWVALATALFTLGGERAQVNLRALAWCVPARLPGTLLGLVLVENASERHLGIAVGAMVLAAVLLSWHAVPLPMTPLWLSAAGFTSGVTGTATSIGGPPVALVLHRRPAAEVRPTLAVFFVLGVVLSLAGLAAAGQLPLDSIWTGLLLVPFVGVGVLLGSWLRGRLPAATFRAGVLLVCAASATGLLLRSLI